MMRLTCHTPHEDPFQVLNRAAFAEHIEDGQDIFYDDESEEELLERNLSSELEDTMYVGFSRQFDVLATTVQPGYLNNNDGFIQREKRHHFERQS